MQDLAMFYKVPLRPEHDGEAGFLGLRLCSRCSSLRTSVCKHSLHFRFRAPRERCDLPMQMRFRTKLDGDASGKMETASFTLPFDSRKVWGKARVPVIVTINQYRWRSTVGHRAG